MGRENPADHGQPVLGVRGAKTAGGEPEHVRCVLVEARMT